MPAPTPFTLLTSQWTKLATDLTQFRDTAEFNTQWTIGPLGTPATVNQRPRLGGWDASGRGLVNPNDLDPLPPEVHAIVQLWSQGLATSFFLGTSLSAATQPAPQASLAFLDTVFAASLLYEYLGIFLRRGLPRGARTDQNAPGPGA